MKKVFLAIVAAGLLTWCYLLFIPQKESNAVSPAKESTPFEYEVDRFADIRILRYKLDGFEKLSLQQKELVYYLTMAGLAGRDIMWDQNCKYNLEVRATLEKIYTSYTGDKSVQEWLQFETYLKQIWMSNGIHHHYSNLKHQPQFSKDYFFNLCQNTQTSVSEDILKVLFDPNFAARKVEKDASKGLIENSSVNFYEGVTTKEAFDFYASKELPGDRAPLSFGINANLRKENGIIVEDVYKVGGKYSAALEQVCMWLEKAVTVAENDKQAVALRKLIEFYKTGDLRTWDDFNIQWVNATEG
ncbi:MAG: dipeptidyl-peptidase 3 family protein, partial [Bacteroidota bacterium]